MRRLDREQGRGDKDGLCNGLYAPLLEARKAADSAVQVRLSTLYLGHI